MARSSQEKFGGKDTNRKLELVSTYLEMYQRALKAVGFYTIYVDAFAGSGEVPQTEEIESLFDEDAQIAIKGSAVRALEIDPPFDRYVLIDKRRACIRELEERFAEFRGTRNIEFRCSDANETLLELCANLISSNQRALVFLDPFGNQVEWSTIKAIAATGKIDLWYLFPAGVGVFRQISNKGTYDASKAKSISRLYGNENWKTAFVKPSAQGELFGEAPQSEKVVTPESAAELMQRQMREVFRGVVLEEMVPLGKHAYPSFYLLFATSNPSKAAKNLASRLAKAAMKAMDRKDGRLL